MRSAGKTRGNFFRKCRLEMGAAETGNGGQDGRQGKAGEGRSDDGKRAVATQVMPSGSWADESFSAL